MNQYRICGKYFDKLNERMECERRAKSMSLQHHSLRKAVSALSVALDDAIRSPLGVVPDSVIDARVIMRNLGL